MMLCCKNSKATQAKKKILRNGVHSLLQWQHHVVYPVISSSSPRAPVAHQVAAMQPVLL
ncbi:hypothetical protein GQ55_8G009900 [Panicum hallii var. hallii]|uniref:Uncharacterized protein n=1 Tax=Panicum hallii var. hallii TaxID=1504633 RepID=A0A2T7CJE6_9POAL|nr:hypothetical protein GQ55_8G009900 [Panicum hallii var. hallii]